MNTTLHNREHELLLEAALAGDVAADDSRLVERLARCGECSAHYRELSALRELLDDAGADERDILATIDPRIDVPGSDRVAPFVRTMVAERRARPLRRRVIAWTASIAAGVVAISGIVRWLLPDGDERERDALLGATQPRNGMTPCGPVREYTPIQWTLTLPDGGYYDVRVYDDRDDVVRDPIAQSGRLERPEWFPESASVRAWPDKIRVQVRAMDAMGTEVGRQVEHAQRLPQ